MTQIDLRRPLGKETLLEDGFFVGIVIYAHTHARTHNVTYILFYVHESRHVWRRSRVTAGGYCGVRARYNEGLRTFDANGQSGGEVGFVKAVGRQGRSVDGKTLGSGVSDSMKYERRFAPDKLDFRRRRRHSHEATACTRSRALLLLAALSPRIIKIPVLCYIMRTHRL